MIYIGIGSNLKSKEFKNPYDVCLKAIDYLKDFFELKKISSFYKSEPVPISDQPHYINAVLEIISKNNENDILRILHKTETKFGRIRLTKNESRILDLDLIDYNGSIINNTNIIIPHPRMHLRKFVLYPLYEIAPDWIHPVFKQKIPLLLKNIKDDQKISKL